MRTFDIVQVPFVIFSIRGLLNWVLAASDVRVYWQVTRGVTTGLLCGSALLYAVYSRLLSATPYIEEEQEAIMIFLYIQFIASVFEHGYHVVDRPGDVAFMIFLIGVAAYQAAYSEFWSTLMYWLMVFSVLRSGESLVLTLTQNRPTYVSVFKMISRLEAVTLVYHLLEMFVFRDPVDRPVAGWVDILPALVALSFAYSEGLLQDVDMYYIFNRTVKTPTSDALVRIISKADREEEFRQQRMIRDRMMASYNSNQLTDQLPLTNSETPQGPQIDHSDSHEAPKDNVHVSSQVEGVDHQ
jgi:hypothetical protein